MTTETFSVGDEEVQITETEDGFEAKPVAEESERGLYLRGEDTPGNYGFEIPVDADFVIDPFDDGGYDVAWHIDDDRSVLHSVGARRAKVDGYDGYAWIESIELVEP